MPWCPQVDCVTLPQFIEEHQIENLDLIKIDTEGAEQLILPSFKSWLEKQTVRDSQWVKRYSSHSSYVSCRKNLQFG